MEFENQKSTNRAKLFLVRLPLMALLIILVLTLMDVIPKATWLIITAGVFLITLLVVLIGRLHYAHFSISSKQLIIRYYHLFPLITDYQEIVVQRSDRPQFEIKYKFFGLIPVLFIKLQTSQGNAIYPPVPLGLFYKDEINLLREELRKL